MTPEDIRVYRVRLKHYVPEILDMELIATSEQDAEETVMQWLNEGEFAKNWWKTRPDLADTEVEDVEETDKELPDGVSEVAPPWGPLTSTRLIGAHERVLALGLRLYSEMSGGALVWTLRRPESPAKLVARIVPEAGRPLTDRLLDAIERLEAGKPAEPQPTLRQTLRARLQSAEGAHSLEALWGFAQSQGEGDSDNFRALCQALVAEGAAALGPEGLSARKSKPGFRVSIAENRMIATLRQWNPPAPAWAADELSVQDALHAASQPLTAEALADWFDSRSDDGAKTDREALAALLARMAEEGAIRGDAAKGYRELTQQEALSRWTNGGAASRIMGPQEQRKS